MNAREDLAQCERDVEELNAAILEAEREASNVGSEELDAHVENLKTLRFSRLMHHFELAKTLLGLSCPIHGSIALIVACPDCQQREDMKELLRQLSRPTATERVA